MPAVLPIFAAAFLSAGAIASTIASIAAITIAGVGLATILTIVGVAVMAISLLTMKTPKPESQNDAGRQLQLKIDPDGSVPIMFGRTATGGYLINRGTFGSKNKYYTIVAALSVAGPIQAYEYFEAGDYRTTFAGNPEIGAATLSGLIGAESGSKLYKNKVRARWLKGDRGMTQSVGAAAGIAFMNKPSDKLSGIAATVTTYEYDNEALPSGAPKSLWIARGVKLYDPRKDSTYQGGSGSHRLGDPSSYEFTENPHIIGLNWTLGRFENGRKVFGIGAKPTEIDFASFIEGANICDANGWKLGGVIESKDDKFAALISILGAGGSRPIARGAQIGCTTNAPKTATLTIREADLYGDVEIQNTTAFRDRKNHVVPRYREEASNWEVVSGDPVTAAVYVAEDGGEAKSRDYELPLVQNAAQAAQLAAYELTNSREFITATLIVGPEFLAARVGEAIMVDLPSFAISNLKCIISGREFDPSGQVVALSVKSETDAKHDFALGRTDVAPASTALVRFDPTLPDGPELESWGVSTATLDNEQGVKLPALRIVGAVDDPNAAAILIDYREVGAVDWIDAGVYDRKSTTIDILGIKPSTAYEVRIRYKMVGGIISPARIYTAESGNFALQALDDAASDGILDPTEKKSVKRNYEELQAGRANLLASAAALNIPTTNYTNALDALTTYLTGLSPAWDDVSKATPIDRAAFLSRFSNAYSARELLNKAIAAETARRANYSQVTDDQGTKPEDNATVGAPAGTYVAGQLSEEVVAQIAQLEAARDALDLEIEDLIADIETTKGRVTAARTDLDQARADLDAEIARAVDSEDAIRTTVTTAQGRADQAYTAFETEKTQRVGADIALGLRIDTTVSSITTEKAALNSRITSEVATLVGADQAITNTIDAAKTEYRGLAADNASAIETEKTTRTTAIGSLAGTVSNLTTSFNGARADIDNLVIDNANRRAEIIQTNSRITIENLALSNADEALTNSLNSAKSEYRGLAADNASAIQTEKTTRTTALQSVASTFTAIDAKFAGTAASGLKTDLNARITNEAAVLAEADRVAAQTVSNLSSSVNGLSSTVNNQAGTIAKVDGRTSAYMTSTINAGDNTAEFQLFADNKAGSSAKLIADQIALQNGSKVALRVVGGDVHIFGKLQVPTLSAITANIGTLRTASTGQRTEITNDGITVFNAAGIAVVQLGIF